MAQEKNGMVAVSGVGEAVSELTLSEIAAMPRQLAEQAIRSRVQTVYLGKGRVLTRVLGRQKLFLSTDDLGFASHVMLDGYWEMWLTQFFARIIQPGMTVIDVGANVGYYSILFGDAVGSGGRVVAIEPIPQTFELLRRSVILNGHGGKTLMVNAALGRQSGGEVHMVVPHDEPKNATVVPGPAEGSVVVPATTLDAVTGHLDRIDLIKIDAEGAEEDIVAGMGGILARCRPSILLEFNAARSRDGAGLLAQLRAYGASLQILGFCGNLLPVEDKKLLEETSGEDVLLYVEGAR